MTNEEFETIIKIITERTGIIPRESHKLGIKKFVEKKLEFVAFQEYLQKIQIDKNEFDLLVNGSTVNETYFFREEKQFEFLKKKIFPEWINKNGAIPIKIWSAACSEGEEAYSISLLALDSKIKVQITASDINTEVLKKCKTGIYKASALRLGDGENFKSLLIPYKNELGDIVFSDSIKNTISTMKINLSKIDTENVMIQKQDIIFVRNVFIYFSKENKTKILKTLSEKYLNENGLIFVSMNEIAQIDSSIMPDSLEKISDGSVFYFRKKSKFYKGIKA